ncbi:MULTISPECIES: esterase/lipase family protein [unclassified Streptomyces]|uniref:esterase/lipase family protein n=1 Tax=unclassified Streptomyces TaxID=2593676 RepID=UPI00380A1B6F
MKISPLSVTLPFPPLPHLPQSLLRQVNRVRRTSLPGTTFPRTALPGTTPSPTAPSGAALSETAPSQTPLPGTVLRAAALDLVVLTGHLLLYPTGIPQERPIPSLPPEAERLPTEGRAQPPVALLHGFADNRSVFVLLRRSLSRHGRRPLISLNYSPLTCDIRTAAELLGRHIEEVRARTGHRRVDVVGHSLGGLIARYYVQRLGGDTRIRVLVTLGTPHGGTTAVPLAGVHPVVRQMRPGSAVIEELRLPAPGCRTRFVSFWSDVDQLMAPVGTARIDHPDLSVENVRVSGVGHLALPVHPGVMAGVLRALESDVPSAAEEADGETIARRSADGSVSVA